MWMTWDTRKFKRITVYSCGPFFSYELLTLIINHVNSSIMENVENIYKTFLALTHDRMTAAVLTLAAIIQKEQKD